MSWNRAWVVAVTTLVMGPWNFGVAQDRPVVRAQGGVVYEGSPQVYYEGDYCEDCEDGHCFQHHSPFAKIHNCWNYVTTLGGKQGGYRNVKLQPNGDPGQFSGEYRDPRQLDYQYLYRYRAPKDLKYPAANQPAGVVVYPYYTVKGPDDFFLNETIK